MSNNIRALNVYFDTVKYFLLLWKNINKCKGIIMIRDKIISVIVLGIALIMGANALAATHQFIRIKNPNGPEFLFAEGGGNGNLYTDYGIDQGEDADGYTDDRSDWATFLLIGNDDGSIQVRTLNGYYFRAWDNGVIRATGTNPDELISFFTPIYLGQESNGVETYSAQSSSGFYLNVKPSGVLKAEDTAPNFPIEIVELEASPAPASNRFVALHASVNEEDENGNDTSYEGFVTMHTGTTQVTADSDAIGTKQTFQFIEMGDGMVRIQSAINSEYLKVAGGGGGDVFLGEVSGGGHWAAFKVIRGLPMLADDEVMLRTANNHYLNITPEGNLEATATTYGQETVFKVVKLEKAHSLPVDNEVTIQAKSTQNYLHYPFCLFTHY